MSKIGFEIDVDTAPTTMFALYQAATVILIELAQDRQNGPWFESLREEIKTSLKNAIPNGMTPEQEVANISAALTAIDAVFARIKWTP